MALGLHTAVAPLKLSGSDHAENQQLSTTASGSDSPTQLGSTQSVGDARGGGEDKSNNTNEEMQPSSAVPEISTAASE